MGSARTRPVKSYYWANQVDAWQGTTNRDNTLKRWAVHLQNDFRARLDWCVKPVAEANHPPQVVVNGVAGSQCLRLQADAVPDLKLDARGSRDPDGDRLSYEWFVYPEPGTYRGPVTILGANTEACDRAMSPTMPPARPSTSFWP